LFIASNPKHCSLGETTNELLDQHKITISRQSFDERFNEAAVTFVKSVFEEQFSKQIDGSIHKDFLKPFTSVRIKDGTRFELPACLKDYFKGFGGEKASASGACIQYEFDLKTGKVLDLEITDAKSSDAKNAKSKIEDIHEGELILRDLGYFSLDVVKGIIKKNAFIISRLNTSTCVYDKEGKELSFVRLYKKMVEEKVTHKEKQVYIGREEKIPLRMIFDIVPEDVYQKRMLKIKAYNHRKGFTTTDQYKARSRFNTFITNIDPKLVPSEQVYQLYKLRWQIELMFKIWKSLCGIDNLRPIKYHRFMCILYAKLLLMQTNSQIISIIQIKLFKKENKLLSKFKCFRTLIRYFNKLRSILNQKKKKWKFYLDEITNMFLKNHWLDKRKNRINFVDIFESYI